MRRYFFIFTIILCVIFCSSACSNYESGDFQKVMIGEAEYDNISEALSNSEVGDTILVYEDVNEFLIDKFNDGFSRNIIDENVYVSYEINKPITIKGVLKNGNRPKVFGSFIVELNDEKFKDCYVTIENLDIIHDYVSIEDSLLNEPFSAGVKVVNGSVNIVDNHIHMSRSVSDDIIENNNLPLYYGIVVSRPENSELNGESLSYDIIKNVFGDYNNQKNNSYSCCFMITENFEDVGSFSPSKINAETYNFSLAIYNNNDNKNNSMIYACDWDGKTDQYNSLIANNINVVDFSKLKNENSRFLFVGDFYSDEVLNIDVYGVMVFTGDVKNIVFNLMNEDAKIQIDGEMLGETIINAFEK